jgi:hypothetical protein
MPVLYVKEITWRWEFWEREKRQLRSTSKMNPEKELLVLFCIVYDDGFDWSKRFNILYRYIYPAHVSFYSKHRANCPFRLDLLSQICQQNDLVISDSFFSWKFLFFKIFFILKNIKLFLLNIFLNNFNVLMLKIKKIIFW